METKKKQFKMPHTFVIIGIIILYAVLLTWIIPSSRRNLLIAPVIIGTA